MSMILAVCICGVTYNCNCMDVITLGDDLEYLVHRKSSLHKEDALSDGVVRLESFDVEHSGADGVAEDGGSIWGNLFGAVDEGPYQLVGRVEGGHGGEWVDDGAENHCC